ncbi:hypothetical protein EDD18DRAFT_1354633 [Armillaria luteobubalina]|uniref:Secreted protein n=1 Tax=Armillaria luteobubalina TaxID=153913 RepID=A0AA39UNB7_9AGAR|nr:hypothetical protein EDD18DRAFT_1354633 [Armillaria luteobubalina]
MTSPQVAVLVIASRLLISLANIHDGSSGYHPLDRLGRYGYGILGGEMRSAQTRVVCNCNPMINTSFGIQRLHWYRQRRHNGPFEPCRYPDLSFGPSHLNLTVTAAGLQGPRIGCSKRLTINQLPQTIMAFNLPLDLNTLIVVQTSSTLLLSILKLGSVSHSLRYLS